MLRTYNNSIFRLALLAIMLFGVVAVSRTGFAQDTTPPAAGSDAAPAKGKGG